MPWKVVFVPEFAQEFRSLGSKVQDELLARIDLLAQVGPMLGRPYVDTLAGSRVKNLKEFRFDAAGGVWRFAFAFDPERRAIVLTGGSKSGRASRLFYYKLIREAERRFEHGLAEQERRQ